MKPIAEALLVCYATCSFPAKLIAVEGNHMSCGPLQETAERGKRQLAAGMFEDAAQSFGAAIAECSDSALRVQCLQGCAESHSQMGQLDTV